MRRIAPILVGLALLLAAAAAPEASAAWTRFSPPSVSSTYAHLGVTRTSDGVLHVVWLTNENVPNNETLMHTSFSAAGKLGTTTPVSSGWSTLHPAALVTAPDGSTFAAYWGGIIQNDPNHQALNGAVSMDGGKTWEMAPDNLLSGQQVGMDTMSAARLGNNLYQAWSSYLHFGNDPSPAFHFSASQDPNACCGYDATVAASSATGAVVAAWYSNQTNKDGVYVQPVNPSTGQPSGPVALVPGTRGVGKALTPPALVARQGAPGFLLAYLSGYPTGNRLVAWTIGSAKPASLGTSQRDILNFALADGPGGRVWAVWERFINGRPKIVVRRSNPAATAWGQPVLVSPPNKKDLWSLSASATTGGSLDVLGAFGDQGRIAEYQTRVLPGLTFAAKPSNLSGRKHAKVKFTVLDAGAPVKGAKVTAGGANGTTGAKGTVTLKLGPFGPKAHKVVAKVSAPGYAPGSLTLSVH